MSELPANRVLRGDCVALLNTLPATCEPEVATAITGRPPRSADSGSMTMPAHVMI